MYYCLRRRKFYFYGMCGRHSNFWEMQAIPVTSHRKCFALESIGVWICAFSSKIIIRHSWTSWIPESDSQSCPCTILRLVVDATLPWMMCCLHYLNNIFKNPYMISRDKCLKHHLSTTPCYYHESFIYEDIDEMHIRRTNFSFVARAMPPWQSVQGLEGVYTSPVDGSMATESTLGVAVHPVCMEKSRYFISEAINIIWQSALWACATGNTECLAVASVVALCNPLAIHVGIFLLIRKIDVIDEILYNKYNKQSSVRCH